MEIQSTLQFDSAGTGPPLFFLHGALSDKRIWMPYQSLLGGRFTLVTYNQRFNNETIDLERHADDLLLILDQSGFAIGSIFAWSWGASIALLAAIKAPRKFDNLILYEPGGPPLTNFAQANMTSSESIVPEKHIALLEAGDDELAAEALVENLFELPQGAYRRHVSELDQRIHRDNARHLRSIYSTKFVFTTSMLKSINQRVLILAGGETRNARLQRLARLCSESIPNSHLALIPGAKHSGPLTHVREIADKIDSFLKI